MTYDEWRGIYPQVEPKYESMKDKAIRLIWESRAEPNGYIKEPMIRFTKPPERNCFSWHQVYHAIAISDVDIAVQTLMNMFPNQDEYGELPDLMTEDSINITATKPPIHGYGALIILDRFRQAITKEHCEKMYPGLEKLYKFWTTLRDTDNDGVPQYNHGCESGFDFSQMFKKGVPVETPDIICYVALLAEALGKITERLGMPDAADWMDKSQHLLEKLYSDFWNGERFIAMLSGLHEVVEFDSLEAYFPFMLAERLPKDIADKMADDLENMYAAQYGLRSEPKTDKPGMIMGFSQVIILPGLYKSGYRELAAKLMRGYVDYGATNEPPFFFPEDGSRLDINGFTAMSALSAAQWLYCTAFLNEISPY